jgi:hypothetical protein
MSAVGEIFNPGGENVRGTTTQVPKFLGNPNAPPSSALMTEQKFKILI